jgi:large subunit ribosomal protein L34
MPQTRRVWQPKKRKRVKKHGFLKRMLSSGGKNVIKRRMAKGRKRLAVAYSGK